MTLRPKVRGCVGLRHQLSTLFVGPMVASKSTKKKNVGESQHTVRYNNIPCQPPGYM